MSEQDYGELYSGNPPENYEKYFVPAIGLPAANALMGIAGLRPGERVLDVACGTGVVARLASGIVGAGGAVTGVDINPGMLAVARASTPPDVAIEWREANAEAMPLPDAAFDVVVCQMGLQFMLDRHAALAEMRRVLVPGGRLIVSAPGPTPALFVVMADALRHHIGAEAAGFVSRVFSLHSVADLQNLINGAGFREISIRATTRSFPLPPPADFLWQYVYGTPLAAAVAHVDNEHRRSFERDVVAGWRDFVQDGALILEARMMVAMARR